MRMPTGRGISTLMQVHDERADALGEHDRDQHHEDDADDAREERDQRHDAEDDEGRGDERPDRDDVDAVTA